MRPTPWRSQVPPVGAVPVPVVVAGDLALRRDPWFDYAEALLQISIVLTSVALITGVGLLLGVSLTLGGLGVFCTLNGYLLFI